MLARLLARTRPFGGGSEVHAPDGYRYAIVDGDLVKLALGTLLVVDAIEGLVN